MRCSPRSASFKPAILATLALAAALLVGGCAQLQPKPVVPPAPPYQLAKAPAPVPNGSIFQNPTSNRPLFEDIKPRGVGDLLTVVFDEQLSATKNAQSNANRTASSSFTPKITPNGLSALGKLGMDLSSKDAFQGGGGSQASNTFTGTMTVTVVQVLANGNFRVHGEKQIAINQGTEFIRFAGIVDPRTISASDSVLSTQVADARIQYVGKGYISDAQHMGWLQRLLLKIWPF